MKLRASLLAFGLLALVGLWAGRSFLTAGGKDSLPSQVVPDGFTQPYVMLETKDGVMTILQTPQIRSLGGKTYLVGRTVSLGEITNDALFESMDQWVCLKNVRRMGESSEWESIHRNYMELRNRQRKIEAAKK